MGVPSRRTRHRHSPWSRSTTKRSTNAHPTSFCAVPSPNPDADGFRVVWYKSTHKMERDAEARGNALQLAAKGLDQIRAKLEGPRPRWKSRASVAQAVEKILAKTGADRWMDYELLVIEKPTYHQEKRGRPGVKTRWRRRHKTRFQLTGRLRQDQIDYDARCDGLFPFITNTALSSQEILSKQPLVDRQHHLLKAVQSGVPVYLHSSAASRPSSSSTSLRCSSTLCSSGRCARPWPTAGSRGCRSIRKSVSAEPPRRSASSRSSRAYSATWSAGMTK
jgi:hypothetical protein